MNFLHIKADVEEGRRKYGSIQNFGDDPICSLCKHPESRHSDEGCQICESMVGGDVSHRHEFKNARENSSV